METKILWGLLLIIGILMNVFIKKIALFVFKKDGTPSRFPIRFIAIVLVINGIAKLM